MNDPAADVPLRFDDRAIYVPAADALVLADVHFGRAVASNVDAPIDEEGDACERLGHLLERWRPETVVIAGDLLHSFATVPRGVESAVSRFVDRIDASGASVVVTPGNHDLLLESVFSGTTAAAHRLADGDTLVCHGHELPEPDADRYIVGHDHPVLSVNGRTHPCFLYGPDGYGDAAILVLPSFTRLAPGLTINRTRADGFLSPLVTEIDDWFPVIRDVGGDETLWFPPLGRARGLL
jgi:uncharacterized protein